MIALRLPFAPSINHAYFSRVILPKGGGRPFVQRGLGKPGKDYVAQVQAHLKEAHGNYSPDGGRFSLAIVATMPDRRKRDLDNPLKVLLDSLTAAGLWFDDEQVDEITIRRGSVQKPGWLDVEIRKIA